MVKVVSKNKRQIHPVDVEKRKNIRTLYRITMNKVKEDNTKLLRTTGQQSFVAPKNFVPSFMPEVALAIRSRDKKKILGEFDNIIKQISANVALKGGSGNTKYYRRMQTQLLMAYPSLNNALFRNECRRRHRKKQKKTIPIAELSEDEDEVPELQPLEGADPRRAVNDKWLVSSCYI